MKGSIVGVRLAIEYVWDDDTKVTRLGILISDKFDVLVEVVHSVHALSPNESDLKQYDEIESKDVL